MEESAAFPPLKPKEMDSRLRSALRFLSNIRMASEATKKSEPSDVVESADYRSTLIEDDIPSGRLFFSLNKGYPVATFSVKRYNAREEKSFYHRHHAALHMELQHPGSKATKAHDWRGRSYHFLIHTTWARCSEARDGKRNEHPVYLRYDPYFLDDPSIDFDVDRVLVVREDYIASIIPFRPQRSLKDKLNEKFQQKHADWEPTLSLSKIRSLKATVAKLWQEQGCDLSTVALAIVYFEKLVLKRIVRKEDRKLTMACCLVLAFKFNEPQLDSYLEKLWAPIEEALDVSRKQVLKMEFAVFYHLDFAFHVPLMDILPHFDHVLKMLNIPRQSYIDEDMWQLHQQARGLADDPEGLMFPPHHHPAHGYDEASEDDRQGSPTDGFGSGSEGSK